MLLGMRSTLLSSFSPAALFAAGEQGVWYDPSDMTTLFEDSAGTTPVTTVERPAGLMLDKSKSGVGTNGAKRVNLLNWTEAFNDAAWSKTAASIAANSITAPDGTTTADTLIENTANSIHVVFQSVSGATGSLIFRVYVKAKERENISLQIDETANGANGCGSSYNVDPATFSADTAGTYGLKFSSPSSSITPVGNDWFLCTLSVTTTAVGVRCYIFLRDGSTPYGSASYTGNGTSGLYIWGADLRLASEASTAPTPYQPITSSWAATIPGNHATQSTPSARPVLSARVNLLEKTEQFNDAYWAKGTVTITADNTTAPDGTSTADLATETSLSATVYMASNVTFPANTRGKASICVKPNANCTWVRVLYSDSLNSTNAILAWFNVATGAVGSFTYNGTATGAVLSISPQPYGFYRLTIEGICSTGTNTANLWVNSAAADASSTRSSGASYWIWGADLRVANDTALPVYQRVNTSTDYDTTGFPMYLRFDGSDDSMATGSINFTSTDEMSVFAGVRKNVDTAQGVVAELSATIASNNGTFLLAAPDGATATFGWDSKGTNQVDAVASTQAAPRTSVLTGLADISGDVCTIRVNGVQADTDASDQGTGNYGNYPLFIGSRNNASARLNGRLYSLIVRGATTSAAQITQTETWINEKTKAY